MSLRNVDIGSAMRRLAERRIEDAMKEGKFDNLPGTGKPLDLEPMPADENARMTWWVLRILRHNDVIPDEIRWRKAVDYLRARLADAREEQQIILLVGEINQLIHKLNTMGTNALSCAFAPAILEDELARFRSRATGAA